jgi:peptide/nickel transport system substrate-binding protein
LLFFLAACSPDSVPPPSVSTPTAAADASPTPPLPAEPTPSPTPPPPSLLTVCLTQEPRSLFLYADRSRAANSVRQAIYDGPYDQHSYDYHPVILAERPSLESGSIWWETVQVNPGEILADSDGNVTILRDGVIYLPEGCSSADCAQTYRGSGAVQIEQLAVRFKLIPGLQWSDGNPLTAGDSVYSFGAAQQLYPAYRAELINATESYEAADETTVVWRGIPGYRVSRPYTHFFTPLPRHAWGHVPAAELATFEAANRTPIGWGPYLIQEWTAGDHITLRKNPLYFRSGEGLPAFDTLVFRFVRSSEEAVKALAAGECDLTEPLSMMDPESIEPSLAVLPDRAAVFQMAGGAWEQLLLGIAPTNKDQSSIFSDLNTRKAAAYCINREDISSSIFGSSLRQDSYVYPRHPLVDNSSGIPFDPEEAARFLEESGWIDHDGNPSTPRIAQGAAGFTPGETLKATFLTSRELHRQRSAQAIQQSLQACGFEVELVFMDYQELLAAGPEGPVFGRQFDLAQFGWMSTLEPPCSLYLTSEVPGPYPEHPRGWGGANAAGFSDAEYDAACREALSTLSELDEYRQAHSRAQSLYQENLPSVPLYSHLEIVIARQDLCGLNPDESGSSFLWNIERLSYGESCPGE